MTVSMKDRTISFQFYKFTNEVEETRAQLFTTAQEMYLHNLLLSAMQEKMNKIPDPNNIQMYFHEQEYLRGQIDMLNHLLGVSEAAKEALVEQERQANLPS